MAGIELIDHHSVSVATPVFANNETRAEANPYPDLMQYLENEENIASLNRKGAYSFSSEIENTTRGYYQSTVTIRGVPSANNRVLCFTNDGLLIAETKSTEQGVYRFDQLLMREKYMFVAQHDDGDPNTPPEYLATAADWQTPTAY